MYFTNALYEPTPDPVDNLAAAPAGAKSYGATAAGGAADGDATVTVAPGTQAADGDAGPGCVTHRP
jgi:hypothetical protein